MTVERLLLYVTTSDGASYVRAEIRSDESDAANKIDREAWHWMSRENVVSAHVVRETRSGGYRRR